MIYKITNTINNKVYIGKTIHTLENRMRRHIDSMQQGSKTYLHNAMRKHGIDNFVIEYICDGDSAEEIIMIEKHNPEYNMTKGGEGGDTSRSPNYKKSMILRRSYKGEGNPNFGKRGEQSPNFGRKKTPEQIQKNKDSYKGKRIPVKVDGVYYDSVYEAAKQLKRSERYVRLHDEINEWKY